MEFTRKLVLVARDPTGKAVGTILLIRYPNKIEVEVHSAVEPDEFDAFVDDFVAKIIGEDPA